MDFRKVLALRGPNIWANFPVLEAWVDLGALKDSPSDELPGFNDRLMSWLPTMIEHRCSVGERGGFFERLRRGTYMAHILEHVTLELQALAGMEVGFGKARETSEEGVYKVVVEYEEEEVGRACLAVARQLCLAAVEGRPFDIAAELQQLGDLARCVRPDPVTAAVLQAARKRRLPAQRLGREGLVQLGHGARQHRLQRGLGDRTPALAASLCASRETMRMLLQAAGVPLPHARGAASAEEAWAVAQELGLPVDVLAPRGQPYRCQRLGAREQVLAAYPQAAGADGSVVVQGTAPGDVWRLLLIGGRLVSALRQDCGRQGFTDATDQVHAEVAQRAQDALGILGLDQGEVTVLAEDIGRPLEAQGGVVVDVSPGIELAAHVQNDAPSPHPVAEALVSQLFPEGQTGRIPIVAVTGVNGKTTTTRLVAHILGRARRCVGMTCTEGIYIDGRRIETGDCSGPQSARKVLRNPRVEAAVLETARGGMLREGLGFDRCSVAVVTNIADGDHLGLADIETPEKLAQVKRCVVDVVLPDGAAVLKADDPLVAEMASHCRGSVIYFCRDAGHPVLAQHRAQTGRAAFVRDGRIILAEGELEIPLAPLECIPLTHGGRVGFQVENALAAAAAAWAVGVPCEVIRAGLETFPTSLSCTPARFNLLSINGVTVLMDYGHNVAALSCLLETLRPLPHPRRTVVYSAAGDRRDSDILRQAQMLGDAFDRVVLYEEEGCMRGRRPGEIIALFRQGLVGCRQVQEVQDVVGAVEAAEAALTSARPGELVMVQVDRVDETLELVRRYLAAGGREVDLAEASRTVFPDAAHAAVASPHPVPVA